jgi:hypothetical protein
MDLKDESDGRLQKLHKAWLHTMYSSLSIIMMIKLRSIIPDVQSSD